MFGADKGGVSLEQSRVVLIGFLSLKDQINSFSFNRTQKRATYSRDGGGGGGKKEK